MTYDEAVDLVLGFRERTGRIPMQKDYEKRIGLDTNKLVKALGINMRLRAKKGVPAWAAINVEVVHAERARKGQVVNIAEANDETSWGATQGNLFENRIGNE
ncbi:MAG: hypothetical protein Q4F58_02210 [Candidatus Saccharibacteria bacterium]|nr:hypothetical protein [Candidatus Saccharibacteria bacterium]